MAVSEAKSFAIAASFGTLSPASIRRAARCTSSRAASTRVAMSARRKATAWCSAIGLPNCSRDFAYSTRVLERRTRDARCRGAQRDARAVERAHEPVEALALLAEPPVLGQLGVLEEHLRVHDRALAHLPHRLAERDAGVALLDDEGRDAARARAGLDRGEDDVVLGEAAVRDPGLLTAEDGTVVRPRGRGRDRGGIGARAGLGRGERGQRRALAGDRLEPAALLLARCRARRSARRRSRPR